MYHAEFSTRSDQPRPALEVALHVRALEHQIALSSLQTYHSGSTGLTTALKTLSRQVRLLLASF